MKKPLPITDDILLDYIDGLLSEEESQAVSEACKDENIAKRLAELQYVDGLLSTSFVMETPSPDFNVGVMNKLDEPIRKYGTNRSWRGLSMVLFSLALVIIGSIMLTDNVISLEAFRLYNANPLHQLIDVSSISMPDSLNLRLVTQVLLFSVLIIALLLLDKIVFRPFFQNRKAQMGY